MTSLLTIRKIQIRRELYRDWFTVSFLCGLISVLIFISFKIFQNSPDAFYLTSFIFFVCFSLQSYRKDKSFVYTNIEKPHAEIFSEYFVLTFPFAVTALFTKNWFCYPVLITAISIIPFLKYTLKKATYFKNISTIIPSSCFEWISGFRKSFLIIFPLYALAIAFCWFKIFPLFLLWLLTFSITAFYREGEPVHILKEGNLGANKFLRQKLYLHSKYLVLLYAPVLFVNTIFNLEYWFINILFIPIQLSLLCFAICFKYSSYQPNKNSIGNDIIISLVALCSLIPFLLPIPFIMGIRYYPKAKKNLTNYLND